MKFIKESISDYIQRLVYENNLDTKNRKITEVLLGREDWQELIKGKFECSRVESVKIPLPTINHIKHTTAYENTTAYLYVVVRPDPNIKWKPEDF